MPVQVSYPGVYIEELPSGVRPITGVPTAIAAFVGYTGRGLDNRPVRIHSFGDFERSFGGLDAESLLSYAVRHFYDNGGGAAYVVRVPKSDSVAAAIELEDAVGGGANTALTVTALSNGAWANDVVVDVDHGVPDGDPLAFNLAVTDLVTGTAERFTNVTLDDTRPNYVQAIVNDPARGSQLVSVAADPTAGRPVETGLVGGDITLANVAALDPTTEHRIRVTMDVPTGTSVDVTIFAVGDPKPGSVRGLCQVVEQRVNVALGAAVDGARVRCVPSASGAGVRLLPDVDRETLPEAVDAVVDVQPPPANSVVGTLQLTNASRESLNVGHYRLGLGRDVQAQTGAVEGEDGTQLPQTADLQGSESAGTGLHALDRVDLFNLLVIPDATRSAASDPTARDTTVDHVAVYSSAIAYCNDRRAFLVVDPPPDLTRVEAAVDWISDELSLVGANAAAYFPRIRVPDPLDDFNLRVFPPSGAVAGLMARIDGERGVWKAPAGTEAGLAAVRQLTLELTDAENGILNPLGLNCLRTFPVHGHVVWGARTVEGADEQASQWKYVPVRRLALMIEETVMRGTTWAVFEPNDEGLWAQLRLNLTNFMHGLFRQGAFQGSTPQQAYLVKCDSETTTQADIDRGIVNVLVGFAPLKPAEFVVIRIQQLAGQSQS